MPRQSRIDAPGALHHIICRGIERRKIFLHNADRDDFVSRLGAILTETATCCFAWALIPNHFHLLLRTGQTPVATVMQRVLTGYAVSFNRRHRRHGHLFQNRYKSILCQEEPYLLELVRYIHLNPLRAGVVSSMEGLDAYPYAGHCQILGQNQCSWMVADEILKRFDKRMATARNRYSRFMAEGVKQGKNPNLTGGGLVRSAGGWKRLREAKQIGVFFKSDERVLGDSNFVDEVLSAAEEKLERKSAYSQLGINLQTLIVLVANLLQIDAAELPMRGKQPRRVQARSLLCFWAVRELGLTTTSLANYLALSQPAVSIAVQRGAKLAEENNWRLEQLI